VTPVTQPKIDEIDATIIKMLLAESRTSFTDIAKECKITVGAVRMRYKRLWKEGVINGEVMLVNPHCLGYRHIVDLGIVTEQEDEEEVARYLETKPFVSQVIKHLSNYNFYGKTALRDLNRLSEIVEDLESNPKIARVDTLIWAEAVNVEFPENLVIKPLPPSSCKRYLRPALTNIDQAQVEIDEIDRKIASILSKSSRTPFRQIAQELHISTKTVIQRYKKLREYLLSRSSITVDPYKLGYKALAGLNIKITNRSKMTEIYNQLLAIPNVIVIIRILGQFDLLVCIALEDIDKMFEVRQKLGKIAGLDKSDVNLTPMVKSWPLHLFSSLLESEAMPKYYEEKQSKKTNNHRKK
jgi:Lrp/AsnC family transcriptional regulator for asnA, asnC and gidA